jgi:uncharacterized protein YkwD
MRRAALAAALVALVAVPTAGARRAGCPGANARPGRGASTAAIRKAVLCLVNRQRNSRHLPALHANSRLDRSAQGWTNHMVATGTFSHGQDFAGRISAAGYRWSAVGENIATGYATPAQVVTGWMRSKGHCKNILSPEFRDLGIGVVARPVRPYGTGGATWTQDFGLAQGTPPPSHNAGPANGCPY